MAHLIGMKEEPGHELPGEIDLVLQVGLQGQYEDEAVTGLRPPVLSFNDKSEILLAPILTYLKSRHFNVSGAMVSYFSPTHDLYEFVGSEPLPPSVAVPIANLVDNTLKLKCRVPQRTDQSIADSPPEDRRGRVSRRTKERKIGFIIEKVARWRNLYNGVSTGRGETVRMTLEEAALQVGISKKSLDDYLLQLRFGRRFGFNFHEHRYEKVGLLRAYVKQCKKLQGELNKRSDDKSEELKEQLLQNGTPACKNRNCCFMAVPQRVVYPEF